jgi:uncharacterized protein
MANRVDHFEITSKIPEQLHTFYGQAFGWEIDANNPMSYGLVETRGGRGINGGIGPAIQSENFVTFYVSVADLAATLAKAQDLGAKVLMEPAEIMPGLSLAMFADPEGNVIGMLHGEDPPDAPPHEHGPFAGDGNPVTWFEIGGNDPRALHRFYTELFGWQIHADNEMGYGEVHPAEGIGGGIGPTQDGPYVTWYVEVPDVKAALDRIASAGGKPLTEPMDVGGVTMAQFNDPEGNRIGVYKMNT